MPRWVWPTIAGVAVLALLAVSVGFLAQSVALRQVSSTRDRLASEVRELRAELDRAQDGAAPRGDADPPDGLLDRLLDGLAGSGSQADALAGTRCLTAIAGPDGDGDGAAGPLDGMLGGELDGLFGGGTDGFLDGLLDGLLGAPTGQDQEAEDPEQLVERTAREVAALRSLDWDDDVEVAFLDTAAVQERVRTLVEDEHDPVSADAAQRLWAALGAIPGGVDLLALQLDLLDAQVAGFYVPETGELVVRVPDDGRLRAADRVALAHELVHALTDQQLGLPDTASLVDRGDADAAYAAQAVVEGDATLVMQQWATQRLTIGDQLSLALDPSISDAGLDDVPHVLQRELLSPYTDGLEHVCGLHQEGGWDAVDAAYRSPPTTSAEVLFGHADDPVPPTDTRAPDGYALLHGSTFGAAPLLWLLEAPGDDPDAGLDRPAERAAAWAGGRASIYGRGDDTAVALALVDSGSGAEPLCATMDDWYAAAFPSARRTAGGATGAAATFTADDHAALLHCDDGEVLLAIAPDEPTARQLRTGGSGG